MLFDTLDVLYRHIFKHLRRPEKTSMSTILVILPPKPRLKGAATAPFKRKKGATMHFKNLKFSFSKTSAKIDGFCKFYDFITPNTKKFRGDIIVIDTDNLVCFAGTDSITSGG